MTETLYLEPQPVLRATLLDLQTLGYRRMHSDISRELTRALTMNDPASLRWAVERAIRRLATANCTVQVGLPAVTFNPLRDFREMQVKFGFEPPEFCRGRRR